MDVVCKMQVLESKILLFMACGWKALERCKEPGPNTQGELTSSGFVFLVTPWTQPVFAEKRPLVDDVLGD